MRLCDRLVTICETWWSRLRTLSAGQLGTDLAELAIILPTLSTVLVGTFWMGRAWSVYHNITRASREGVKYAVLPSCASCGNAYPSSADVQTNYVNPVLVSAGLDPTKVVNYGQTMKWLENTSPQQCGIVINFSYPVELTVPFTKLNALTVKIPASVQMRIENQHASGTCP